MLRLLVAFATTSALLAAACTSDPTPTPTPAAPKPTTFILTSTAFADNATIPTRHTCDGENRSPPLAWSAAPAGTRAFALVMRDTDSGFAHWAVHGLDGTLDALPDRMSPAGELPGGAAETTNDFGDRGYGGPCPPRGSEPHHYVFTLYALSAPLSLAADPSATDVEAAAAGALGTAVLTGLSGR